MEQKTVKRAEVYALINTNPTHIFGMVYKKADGSIRTATCKLHVTNPTYCLKPGTGSFIGESAEHALTVNNNIKYFDMGIKDENGKRTGGYRTAKIDNIISVTVNGVTYAVID